MIAGMSLIREAVTADLPKLLALAQKTFAEASFEETGPDLVMLLDQAAAPGRKAIAGE